MYPAQSTDPLEADTIASDDLLIKANRGIGYWFGLKKSEAIDFHQQRLEWNEKIKTNSDALLQFGRKTSDQHYLLQNSVALLAKTDSGKRLIILEKGILRSRNLGEAEPKWTIMIGSWLQIDADAAGDIIAVIDPSNPELASIVVLRGHALIRKRPQIASATTAAAPVDTGYEIRLLQGTSLSIRKSDPLPPPLRTPRSNLPERVIAETTPEFLPVGLKEYSGGNRKPGLQDADRSSRLPSEDFPAAASPETAKSQAIPRIGQRDFFGALAALIPSESEARADYELAMLLGRASRGIYLYQQAAHYFESAILTATDNPDPYFELGEMSLNDGAWKDAADYFEMANLRNFKDLQLLNYYRGLAEFNAGERIPAYQHFRLALWHETNADISASAREYITKTRRESTLDIRFGAGSFYDSNIFRLATGESLPNSLRKKADHGYSANFGISLTVFEKSRGTLLFSYDIEKQLFSSLELVQYGLTRQIIASNFNLKIGGDSPEEAIYEVGIKPYAGLFSVGDSRAMDLAGVDLYILVSNLWSQPSFHYESAVRSDPYPSRDDVLDPILREATSASDRSNRYGAMALYMRPSINNTWTLDLGLKSGVTAYNDRTAESDSNTDWDFRLGAEYHVNVRNQLLMAVSYRTRNFYDSEDARVDKAFVNDAGWRFNYTPNFSHALNLSHENGDSTRRDAKFSRSTANLAVELAF